MSRKQRTCEVCSSVYVPSYREQRTCGRACGVLLKGHVPGGLTSLSVRDLDAPLTRERHWLEELRRTRYAAYMLARYHRDPANWSTARKRRRIFDRDGWRCRVCNRTVRQDVKRNDPRRANVGHIIAKSQGGPWADDNLATLCFECNRKDGSTHKVPIQTHISMGSF